ncbi:MAG: 50S ribosomal protein L6 [Candidatus Kerfeldbacteria bacterium]
MSRIGKKPIEIPENVTVEVKDGSVMVKGPKGELTETLHPFIHVNIADNVITVTVKNENLKEERAMWGTFASLISNMIIGVTEGYEKKLEITGVGYGWQVSGKKLTIKAGFSHTVDMQLPDGLEASVEDNVLTVAGINKQLVGKVAANIKKVRKPEPYKGSGIKYVDEQIIRKAGKQAAGAEGA